ncbi:DNA-binding protein [Pseudomonas aeruginosa]|nr:DNA-binding protein [Pseudomonas aeruginosa]MCS8510203.1 DNA-binding protein [Pseudomonas aeruginosa]MCS8541289.1 DNA-binding protein [Pseudomonas aeruginosa]MCT0600435.1 DNA-binding protein [Pseudomonas aeruginosa]
MKPTKRQHPVTLAEVAEAMRELQEEGTEPSVRAVRARVGGGSNTTLMRFIDMVRSGSASPQQHLDEFPSRLESLCREMVQTLGELADERVAKERAEVQAVRRNIEARWNTLLMEKETAVNSFEAEKRITADLTQRLEALTEKLESVVADRDVLKDRANVAEALNEQLNERLLGQSRQIDEMKRMAEHYEQQVAAQREQDARRHSKQIEGLESSLRESHANELRLTEQLGNAKRELERLTKDGEQLSRRAAQAEAQQSKLEALVSDLSVEQLEFKRRDEQRERQLNATMTTNGELQTQLARMQSQIIEVQSRSAKQLEDMATDNRSVIINLVDHSRRVFEIASLTKAKDSSEFKELAIAQREIERLFHKAGS